MPLVSICVPTYNNVSDVKRLLESIEEQTFTDYEVLISDDSTNDEIMTLVSEKEYVNYQKNEKPLGHIFNWNAAINMATGDLIKIMFSDDWFAFPDSLEKLVNIFTENKWISFAFCGSRQTLLVDDVDKLTRSAGEHRESFDRYAPTEYISELKKDYRYLFISNQIGCPSATMYRRNADNSVFLFDEKSNWASDVFLYMDILKNNSSFEYTEEPLICVGMHENQYTETFDEHDMRIYNDYKYMYNKYNLKEEPVFKNYFLNKYIIPFKQGKKEAVKAGVNIFYFYMCVVKEFFAIIGRFTSNRFRKLCGQR